MDLNHIDWAPVTYFVTLFIAGLGFLFRMGKFETKTEVRLSNVEGKVDLQGTKLDTLSNTVSEIKGMLSNPGGHHHQ